MKKTYDPAFRVSVCPFLCFQNHVPVAQPSRVETYASKKADYST